MKTRTARTSTKESLTLLVLAQDEAFFLRLKNLIEKEMKTIKTNFKSSGSFSDARKCLKQHHYDLCLVDERVGPECFDFVSETSGKDFSTPVIFLTDREDHKTMRLALKAGASDCLSKSNLSSELLAKSLHYALQLHKKETIRRQIEEQLHIAYKQNQQLLSSITSILIGIGPDGCVNHWNAVAEASFGLPASKVLNRPLLDARIHWEAPRMVEAIRECKSKGKPVRVNDVSFTRADGKDGFLGFTIIPVRNDRQNPSELSGFLLFGADITARKEAEEQLRVRTNELRIAHAKIEQEKVQYATLLESIGDGMIAFDRSAQIMMMNKQAEEMLGWTSKEALGKSFYELIPIEDEKGKSILVEKRPVAITLASGKRISGRAYYLKKNRRKFPAAITVSPIILEGKVMGAIEIFRDITKEMEMDRMKSDFISTVSHELRTPLTGIREGVAQVLEGILGPTNPGQQEFLTISLNELDRLTTIVNDLLDIAKIESGKAELKKSWVDLEPLMNDLVAGYQGLIKNKKLTLKCVLPKEGVQIFADREKIIQILTNLLSNAYKFTDQGGSITIEVTKQKEFTRICVEDTGVGIEKANLTKIFDRFVQVGRIAGPGLKGTGLGLPISKSLVEMHQGRIWAESEVGRGSRFVFTIPCETEEKNRMMDKKNMARDRPVFQQTYKKAG